MEFRVWGVWFWGLGSPVSKKCKEGVFLWRKAVEG